MTNLYRSTIPVTYSRVLADLMTERGHSLESILANSELSEKEVFGRDFYVSPVQLTRMVRNSVKLAGDSGLGLKYGNRLDISTLGTLGNAVVTSQNIQQALEVISRYFKTRCLLVNARFFIDGEDAVIEFEEAVGLGQNLPFTMESVMTSFYKIVMSMIDRDLVRGELRFSYPEPSYSDEYYNYFKHFISFDRGANQIRFDASVLETDMPFDNKEAYLLATQQCEARLQELTKMNSLITRVKDKLRDNPTNFPSLNLMAEQCFMSPRTLTRRLRKLNTSYQQVLDGFRCSLAIEYLRGSGMTVDEISRKMGYNDPSNFGRAFKSWTGQPPSYYRVCVAA